MKYKLLRTWCFYIPWSYFLKLNHEQNFKDIKYFFKRLKNKILTHIVRERERERERESKNSNSIYFDG